MLRRHATKDKACAEHQRPQTAFCKLANFNCSMSAVLRTQGCTANSKLCSPERMGPPTNDFHCCIQSPGKQGSLMWQQKGINGCTQTNSSTSILATARSCLGLTLVSDPGPGFLTGQKTGTMRCLRQQQQQHWKQAQALLAF